MGTKRALKARVSKLSDAKRAARRMRPRWPACKNCGIDDWYFVWGGNVEKTFADCVSCGKRINALEAGFDPLTIKVIASPVVSQ